MNRQISGVVVAVAITLAMKAGAVLAQDTPWGFEIAPYIWGMGIDADIKVRGREAEIDTGFDDLADRIDFGGSLFMLGSYDHFVMLTQLDYISTDSDELDDSDQRAGGRFESDLFIGTIAAGYRFGEAQDKRNVEVLLGARQLSMDSDLTLTNIGKFSRDEDYFDPVIMVRPSFRLSDRWRFGSTLAYGGGGDSESTWELAPTFMWQINDHLGMRIGYRRVYYNLESDSKQDEFDGTFHGFTIGFGGTFGSNYVRTAAITPAPEPQPQPLAAVVEPSPPPREPPRDSDGDGVTDDIDKCGGTASGEKVDAIGCGINVTLRVQFAHDSAEVPPDAQPELQRLVEIMNSTSVISGIVEGYTDSSGSAQYNAQLSKRRAEAVAEYLIFRGVSRDRVTARGLGESAPVADNRTEEGRAENRRVVLRRVDAQR